MDYTNNTQLASKLAGFAAAVLVTAAVNGSLLWGANDLSQRGVQAPALMAKADTASRVVLPTVTIRAHRA